MRQSNIALQVKLYCFAGGAIVVYSSSYIAFTKKKYRFIAPHHRGIHFPIGAITRRPGRSTLQLSSDSSVAQGRSLLRIFAGDKRIGATRAPAQRVVATYGIY